MPAPSSPTPLDDEHDTPMTGTYVAVVVVEAIILTLLWIFGKIYT